MIQKGLFRSDLYYRLNVIPIKIPPLRERKKDILLLLEFFLKKYNRLLHKKIEGFAIDVQEILLRYDWPGNVRELENSVEYAVNFENTSLVTKSSLTPRLKEQEVPAKTSLKEKLQRLESEEIQKALQQFGPGVSGMEQAAWYLGVSRATLYRKILDLTNKTL
jgi:transcriptional regulator with PAS, ATPase and Fis domain